MTSEDLEQRLSGVASRWKTARRATLMASTAWRESWKPPEASFLLAIFTTFALAPLEIVAWGLGDFLQQFLPVRLESLGAIPLAAVLAVLLILWLVNGWLVDHAIERACRRRSGGPWQRILRFLRGGVPMLGLYVIPEWHHLPEGRDAMVSGAGDARLDLRATTGSAGGPRWSRRAGGSILDAGWLLIPNALFLFFIAFWIAAPRPADPSHPWRLWAAIVTAHGVAFFAMRTYVTRQTEWRPGDGSGRQLAGLIPWAWLLPMPIPFVCLLWVLSWNYQGGASKALTYRIYLRRNSFSQLPAWADLQGFLADRREARRWQWPWTRREVSLAAGRGEGEQRLTSLCRLKTLLLGLDGMLLGVAAIWLVRREPATAAWGGGLWGWLTYGALGLAAAGFLAALVIGLGLRVGPGTTSRDTAPVIAGYVSLTQLAFLAGLWTGIYLEQGQHREIGALLQATALLGVVVGCLWLVVSLPWRRLWPNAPTPGDTLLWIGLLFAVCLLGIGLLVEPPDGAGLPARLRTAALLAPVWNLGLALLFLKDFLRPFRLREALQLRPRWRMAVLLLTLAAPLGGLAIPFWIWARQRWWPGWERGWNPGAPSRPQGARGKLPGVSASRPGGSTNLPGT